MMTTAEQRASKSSTSIVLEAVRDLHAQEQVVTRETLAQVTGLKMTVIDDRIGVLVDDGQVVRVRRGVYVPAVVHAPSRPMSKTVLPDGTIKIEIGDELLTLTPREDRTLALLQAGVAVQYASIESGHQFSAFVAEISRRLAGKAGAA